jgi:hypothetical protein
MLVIRDAQLHLFEQQSLAQFEDLMLDRIRATFPSKYELLGETGTREFIRRAIDSGAKYRLTTRGAVGVLIELLLQYGEKFENSPDPAWAWKVFTHGALPAHLKVDMIRDRFDPLLQGRTIVVTE